LRPDPAARILLPGKPERGGKMGNTRERVLRLGLVVGALLLPLLAAGQVPERLQPIGPAKKVFVVIFENMNYSDVISQPFFAKLASQGGNLRNFHAETHPSQPNYIGLIGGDLLGSHSDANIDIDATHLGDLLEAKGKTWKVYAEAYPGNCFLGARSGTYVRKHVPFLSFKNVQRDPRRCANIVEASAFGADLQLGKLPELALYIPDLNNDGHDTDSAYADRWFSGKFGPLLQDPNFTRDQLFVATFDESGLTDPTNQIYTVLLGDSVAVGSASSVRYDHYSLLRTFEDLLGLGSLNRKDATAQAITGIWKGTAAP
jgi:hypothetical protein